MALLGPVAALIIPLLPVGTSPVTRLGGDDHAGTTGGDNVAELLQHTAMP